VPTIAKKHAATHDNARWRITREINLSIALLLFPFLGLSTVDKGMNSAHSPIAAFMMGITRSLKICFENYDSHIDQSHRRAANARQVLIRNRTASSTKQEIIPTRNFAPSPRD
jgi:hypothetical protein